MKFNELFTETVLADLEAGAVPALIGEPGIGKSSFVEDLARITNTRCFTLPCNQLADKADLTGARLVKDETSGEWAQRFFPHFVITEAILYAEANPNEYPILFLDEINRSTSDVTSGVLTLVTLRRMGHKDLPPNLRIVVAGNDKGNVTALDEASVSRFVIYRVEPDASTLVSILGQSINPWVKTVLENHPQTVFLKGIPEQVISDGTDDDDDDTVKASVFDMFDASEEMRQLTTPRTIDFLSRYLNKLPVETLTKWFAVPVTTDGGRQISYLQEVLESHTGNTEFTTQLIAVIGDDLSKGTTQSTQQVVRPRVYDQLKQAAQTSVDNVEQTVARMSDNDASGALIFALYEREDNAVIIRALNDRLQTFASKTHMPELISLMSQNMLHRPNLDTFMACSGGISERIRPALSMLGIE